MKKLNLLFTFKKIGFALLVLSILLFINISFSQEEEVVVPETPTEVSPPETPTQETISTPLVSSSIPTTFEKSYIKAPRPVSLKGEKVKIETIAQEINNSFGINLILKSGVAGQRLDLNITTDDLLIALDSICAPNGWVWVKENETTYSIMTRKEYEDTVLPTQVEKKVFKLENISATDADRILRPLATPRIGKIYGDPRTNKLFVEDLPNVISEIEYILGQIDVKLVMRVFYIKHADVADLASKLDTYRSETGEIQVDAKTRQIIVTDKIENIRKMEAFIETVDIGTELRVFELNNLTKEEQSNLLTILQNIVTENALLYNDERSGTIIVDDVPEILDKVQKIIDAYDKPNKQVLISADIVQTILSDTLSLGIDYEVSKDMFKAYDSGIINSPYTKDDKNIFDDLGNVIDETYNYRDLFPYMVFSGNTTTIDYLSKHIRARFQAIANDKNTQILLSPRIQVKNHEEATIEVGKGVPFLTRYFDTEGRVTSEQPSVVRAGLKFGITPHIMNNGLIEIEVSIRNNDARVVDIKGFQGQAVSAVEEDTQEAETILLIPNNGTRVIGGLVSKSDTNTAGGLPFLYKIPILGELAFGNRARSNSRNNILLFITPSIIEDKQSGEKLEEFYDRESEKTKESKEKAEAEYIEAKLSPEKIREKFGIPSEKATEIKPSEKKEKTKTLKEAPKTPAPKPTPTPKAEEVKVEKKPVPTPQQEKIEQPTKPPKPSPTATPQAVKKTPIPAEEEKKPVEPKEKELIPVPTITPTPTPAPSQTPTPVLTSTPIPTPTPSITPSSSPKPEQKTEEKPQEESKKTEEKKERKTSYELGPIKGEINIQYSPVPAPIITPEVTPYPITTPETTPTPVTTPKATLTPTPTPNVVIPPMSEALMQMTKETEYK